MEPLNRYYSAEQWLHLFQTSDCTHYNEILDEMNSHINFSEIQCILYKTAWCGNQINVEVKDDG